MNITKITYWMALALCLQADASRLCCAALAQATPTKKTTAPDPDPFATQVHHRLMKVLNNLNAVSAARHDALEMENARLDAELANLEHKRPNLQKVAIAEAKVASDKRQRRDVHSDDLRNLENQIQKRIDEVGWPSLMASYYNGGGMWTLWQAHFDALSKLRRIPGTEKDQQATIALAESLAMEDAIEVTVSECEDANVRKHNSAFPNNPWAVDDYLEKLGGKPDARRTENAEACANNGGALVF